MALDPPYLDRDVKLYRLSSGMFVSDEVNLGTVMEYLPSLVQKVAHEAGRET